MYMFLLEKKRKTKTIFSSPNTPLSVLVIVDRKPTKRKSREVCKDRNETSFNTDDTSIRPF